MPHPILDAPIRPLRQRLIDDMAMRRFSQEAHLTFARHAAAVADV